MALPVLTKRLVEIKLGVYCEKRIPHHIRDQVRLSYTIRGDSVTLNEEGIALDAPKGSTGQTSARLPRAQRERFVPADCVTATG